MNTVIIMAGGTGGHVYPALAVGTALRERGVNVFWMGVRNGLEQKLARNAGFVFDSVRTRGLWGKGMVRWLTSPLWLTVSILQCIGIILRRRPDALLGMGGYVCGPGGLASWILRRPLVIHESNVVPGLTNRVLAFLASRILIGFSNTQLAGKPVFTGTPVRAEIIKAGTVHRDSIDTEERNLRLLVIGGSQGAQALNDALPLALGSLPENLQPHVMHQTGLGRKEVVSDSYVNQGIEAQVLDYIDDMASAYLWADIVVARAGAMTLAEISATGLAAILVPYPHAARDHQRANAEAIAVQDSAIVCKQNEQLTESLGQELKKLISDRNRIREMSNRIRNFARTDATECVVKNCMEVMQS